MDKQLRWILTACIVNFGLTFAQQPDQRDEVRTFLDTITKGDGQESEIYREILRQKVRREQHAFDEVGEYLRPVARNINSKGKRAITKRETDEVGGNGNDAVDINVLNSTFKYRFDYVSEVREVQDQGVSELKHADARICQLSSEEVLQICEKALEDPVARDNDIQLVHRPEVSEEKVYEFAVTDGPNNTTQSSSVIAPACLCSTSPPIYLRGNSSGSNIDVYISYQDKFVNHLVRRANFSFNFEMVAYAKHTSVTVKPYSAKVIICQLKREELDQLCNLMLAEPFAKNYELRRVEGYGPPLFEERMYEIKLADFEYTFEPPLFMPACMCPTRPPTYFKSKYPGGYQKVYVVIRDELDSYEARGCVEKH